VIQGSVLDYISEEEARRWRISLFRAKLYRGETAENHGIIGFDELV